MMLSHPNQEHLYKVVEASRIKSVRLPTAEQAKRGKAMRSSPALAQARNKAFAKVLTTPRSAKRRLGFQGGAGEEAGSKRRKSTRKAAIKNGKNGTALDFNDTGSIFENAASDEEDFDPLENERAFLRAETRRAREERQKMEDQRKNLEKSMQDLKEREQRMKDLAARTPTPAIPAAPAIPAIPTATTDGKPALLNDPLTNITALPLMRQSQDHTVQLLLAHEQNARQKLMLEANRRASERDLEVERERREAQRKLHETRYDAVADEVTQLNMQRVVDTLRYGNFHNSSM